MAVLQGNPILSRCPTKKATQTTHVHSWELKSVFLKGMAALLVRILVSFSQKNNPDLQAASIIDQRRM